jgi:hypothetical protein
MSIDVGSVYPAAFLVTDDQGRPVNPATATLFVTVGLDAPVSVPVQLPPTVTGLLAADFATVKEGLHQFSWATTGPVSVGSDYVNVRAYRSVLSLAESRDHLGYTDSRHDDKIRLLAAAATKLTEGVVGTCVIRTFTSDWIGGAGNRDVLQLTHRPLPSATCVTSVRSVYTNIGGPSWGAADLIVNPDAGTIRTISQLPFWYGPWLADYQAGRIVIGENIVNGTKEILWDLFATQRSLFADVEQPDAEQIATIESLIPAGYEMPRKALEQLEPDRMPAFG